MAKIARALGGKLNHLGTALDEMAGYRESVGLEHDRKKEAFQRSEEELLKARNEFEICVEQRNEEFAKANEDLRRGAEKLKFFAYSVIHDLRSPAVGVHGLAMLLRKQYGNLLDEKGNLYCDKIMRISEHIVELVEKINIYIATQESPLRIEPVNFGEILKVLREEFSLKLGDRCIKWFEPEAGIEVRADRIALLREPLAKLVRQVQFRLEPLR